MQLMIDYFELSRFCFVTLDADWNTFIYRMVYIIIIKINLLRIRNLDESSIDKYRHIRLIQPVYDL